LVENR